MSPQGARRGTHDSVVSRVPAPRVAASPDWRPRAKCAGCGSALRTWASLPDKPDALPAWISSTRWRSRCAHAGHRIRDLGSCTYCFNTCYPSFSTASCREYSSSHAEASRQAHALRRSSATARLLSSASGTTCSLVFFCRLACSRQPGTATSSTSRRAIRTIESTRWQLRERKEFASEEAGPPLYHFVSQEAGVPSAFSPVRARWAAGAECIRTCLRTQRGELG